MKLKKCVIQILALAVFSFLSAENITAQNSVSVINYTGNSGDANQRWIWNTFRERNPDITLDIANLYLEYYHARVANSAVSGNLPDVLYVWSSGRSDFLHQNRLLKDLSPLIERDNLKDSFFPAALDPSQQAANYIAMIPQTITASHAFYVNLEVLNACGLQPAKTYTELKAQAPVLRAHGYDTILIAAAEGWVMQSCLFSMLAGRFCGAGWHQRILSGQAKFTDSDFVNALTFVKTMFDDGVIPMTSLGVEYGEVPVMFATNKSAYYIDGDWRVGAFLTDPFSGMALISIERQNNFLITVFPIIENAKINKSTSIVMGAGWAVNAAIPAGSQREERAWRLIKWLTGAEVQTREIEAGTYSAMTNRSVNASSLNLEPIQRAAANFAGEYTTGTCIFDAAFHSNVFEPLNTGLLEIALGTKTPRQAAAELQQAFDAGRARGDY